MPRRVTLIETVSGRRSKLKRNRIDGLPLLLRNEMNISLRGSPVQMAYKPGDLVPDLPLRNQNRDERMPQRMKTIEALELRALDQLLEEPVRPITPALLNRPLALVLPSSIDARVIKLVKDGKQNLRLLG